MPSEQRYASITGPAPFHRSKEKRIEICGPWTALEPGLRPLEEWVGTSAGVERDSLVSGFSMVAAILVK